MNLRDAFAAQCTCVLYHYCWCSTPTIWSEIRKDLAKQKRSDHREYDRIEDSTRRWMNRANKMWVFLSLSTRMRNASTEGTYWSFRKIIGPSVVIWPCHAASLQWIAMKNQSVNDTTKSKRSTHRVDWLVKWWNVCGVKPAKEKEEKKRRRCSFLNPLSRVNAGRTLRLVRLADGGGWWGVRDGRPHEASNRTLSIQSIHSLNWCKQDRVVALFVRILDFVVCDGRFHRSRSCIDHIIWADTCPHTRKV